MKKAKIVLILLLFVNICYSQKDILKEIFDVKKLEVPSIIISDINAVSFELNLPGGDLKYIWGSPIIIEGYRDEETITFFIDGKYMFLNLNSMNLQDAKKFTSFYYFKNLKFKKGSTIINKYNENQKIRACDIDISDRLKNILLKNVKVNGEYKDIYFRDIEFIVIDFADTKNVKIFQY